MFQLAIFFFGVSILAGLLGFGGIAGAAAGMAKFFFGAFLAVAVVCALIGYAVFHRAVE